MGRVWDEGPPTGERIDNGKGKGKSKISEVKKAHDASGRDWGRSGRSVKQVVFTVSLYQLSHEIGSSEGCYFERALPLT